MFLALLKVTLMVVLNVSLLHVSVIPTYTQHTWHIQSTYNVLPHITNKVITVLLTSYWSCFVECFDIQAFSHF